MNLERNNLIGAKEFYLEMMSNLTLVKRKREDREQKKREKRDRGDSNVSATSIQTRAITLTYRVIAEEIVMTNPKVGLLRTHMTHLRGPKLPHLKLSYSMRMSLISITPPRSISN